MFNEKRAMRLHRGGDWGESSTGIRVKTAEGSGWRPATSEKPREIAHHDAEIEQKAREQEKRDQDAFARYEAGRAHDWED